jgi:hypothetical protein
MDQFLLFVISQVFLKVLTNEFKNLLVKKAIAYTFRFLFRFQKLTKIELAITRSILKNYLRPVSHFQSNFQMEPVNYFLNFAVAKACLSLFCYQSSAQFRNLFSK